ncbi:MAG: outer membrane protein assembly factor BamA [Nitrospirae bacterium]|nr:MAG: outer membrane protein assembly factor BamA [Nitrospirota bacterium]
MKRVFILLLGLKFFFFILIPPSVFSQTAAPLVNSIEIRGLKRTDEGAIRKRLSQKVGQPLSQRDISKDIKSIYEMGYFEDVRVETEPFEGGLKLIYIVKEKPSIIKVSFSGNEEFDDEKLKEQITIIPGAIADVTLIQRNVASLKAFYEQEGYYLASIVPVVKRVSPDEATLTFLITEGEKIKIDEIEFEGNSALSDGDIKDVMETSEWWIFSYFTKSGYYRKDVLDSDIQKIKDLYYDNGFLNVVVSKPEVILDKKKKELTIKINIIEGPQYRVSSIKFKGHEPSEEKQIKELIPLKEGEVFSKKLLREGIENITNFYSEHGYAMASVEPTIETDENKHLASVLLNIDKGHIFRIGRIEIIGNTRTLDKVIRREMRLDEGDIFNSKLLKRSYQKINNLNFFEQVELTPKPRLKDRLVDIDIKVKEKATGFLSIGGGYSTVDKFVAMVDLTQANLFGTGRYLKLRGELGGSSSFYEIAYRDPWFLDYPVSITLSLYRTTREYISYDKKAIGGSVGFGKRFNDFWSASITYKYEKATIENVDVDAPTIIKDQIGTNVTSSITPSVARDSRDNYLDPHSGSRNSFYFTYAGLGGDNHFFKTVFDSAWFFPLTKRTTIALRGRVGYATGLFEHELPLYERFYVGGIYTVRGLGFGDGGPKDENGDPIGGTKELILNAEYIFPIVEELKLKGVVFFDAGRAYGSDEPFGSDLRYTTGAGFRWFSPMGPIRIEYGYNLDRRDGEDSGKIEFSFGGFF